MSAGLGAAAPGGPGGDHAVDRAVVSVARGGLHYLGALDAAEARVDGDGALTGHGAAAASLGALAEGSPSADLAVDRASLHVAVADVGLSGALDAAVLDAGDDRAKAGGAAAASSAPSGGASTTLGSPVVLLTASIQPKILTSDGFAI